MAAIKLYTSFEQSKKLAEFLPLESADMWYSYYGNSKYNHTIAYKGQQWFLCQIRNSLHDDIPCWSLGVLLNILPKIHGLKPILDLEECSIQYSGINLYIIASNPIDACYEMIIKLNELKLL